MDGAVRISEAARRLGVHPGYLRQLEKQGRVPAVGYDRGGRLYTLNDLAFLKAMGIGSRPPRLKRPDEAMVATR